MKPVMVQVIERGTAVAPFVIKTIDLPCFSTELHFHEECLLVYVLESAGKRIVGDDVTYFQGDELVFIGPNLPHVWHNSDHRRETKKGVHGQSIALYFNHAVLLEHISKLIDITPIQVMLHASRRGMKFHGEVKRRIVNMLLRMHQLNELQMFSRLMRILELMCETKEFSYLASAGYINNYERTDNSRMDRVYKYIINHFTEDISLSDIAEIANMNVQAFCRYFKARTGKSFTLFINEIRIGHACKLLLSPEENIIAIARKSGFNSLSNFNRFFKEIKGMTPSEFKKHLIL